MEQKLLGTNRKTCSKPTEKPILKFCLVLDSCDADN